MQHLNLARPLKLASAQRRTLLKAFAASGLLASIARQQTQAQTDADYKAMVCINLNGGNDGENTLIRADTAGYQNYAAVRTPASRTNIAQAQLLPIQPASLSTPYGFHPSCAGLKTLFDQRKLAVVTNMGMLVRPSTRASLNDSTSTRPPNLFSHADQELAMHSADHSGFNRIGWGGRIADRLDPFNPGTLFPPLITTSGMRTFTSGLSSIPLFVPNNPYFALYSSGDGQGQFDALRDAALREILVQSRSNTYDLAAQLLSEEGLAASSVVFPILKNAKSIVTPFFSKLTSDIAGQLKTVALMMEGRAQTKLKRQVFYSAQGGYDTHGSQLGIHSNLLKDLSDAMLAFQNAVEALGLANNVTAFTLSEFGRTLKPASGDGTDHGWGNYAFVLGGAVKGGDFYGTMPTLILNGPDDMGDAGRWIPTTSLAQYGATLTRWLGLSEADLSYVFPTLSAFPNSNVGFMKA